MRKSLRVLLALAVLGYLALCALMYAKQREMVYLPQYTRAPASESNFSLDSDGTTLRGWLANAGQRDAVVYFGGNAEDIRGMHGELGRRLRGHSIYALAYRSYGASEGSPSEPGLLADALALLDQVRANHPGGTITLVGRSLGSGVASYAASRSNAARLVLITPFDSLVGVGQAHYPWLPVDWMATERFESVTYLARYPGRVLVLRAGQDTVVPPANTDRLIAGLPSPPQVFDVPAATHDSLMSGAAEFQVLVDFISE